jgi:hypothetical protein
VLNRVIEDCGKLKMLFVASSLCLFLLLSSMVCMVTGQNEAASRIVEAQNALNSAYEAVLEAEKAGANITSLLSNLTEAGELLSNAKLVLSTNESAAVDFALQSQAKLNGFLDEADALRISAAQQRYWDFIVNIVGSILVTIIVICSGVFAWFFLNRKYEQIGGVAQ